MIIPIVIGAFGTVTKWLLKRLEDLEVGDEKRPSKLQHCWERPEYWEESWRLGETCCHSNSSERLSANADVKNSQRINNILCHIHIQSMFNINYEEICTYVRILLTYRQRRLVTVNFFAQRSPYTVISIGRNWVTKYYWIYFYASDSQLILGDAPLWYFLNSDAPRNIKFLHIHQVSL